MSRIEHDRRDVGWFRPLVPVQASAGPPTDPSAPPTQAPTGLSRQVVISECETMNGLRILVVERDLMVGPLLAEMLEDLGYVVCAVETDVANAVAASAHHHPDLMIVDLGFGRTQGAIAIKEMFRDEIVPCIFLTDDVLPDPSRAPAEIIVRKPFRGAEIVAAIRRATSVAARSPEDLS